MFVGRNGSHASSNDSSSYSDSCRSPVNGSFSSTTSWDFPNPAVRRRSFSSMKFDDMSFGAVTYSNAHPLHDELTPMSEMNPDMMMMSAFLEQDFFFQACPSKAIPSQGLLEYNDFTYSGQLYEPFDLQNGVRSEPPELELGLYSPVSTSMSPPVSMDFVVPSQTTLANTYDAHPSLHGARSLHSGSPVSDYATDFLARSPGGIVKSAMPCSDSPRPSSTTPLRSTVRQPIYKRLQTSKSLQQIQSEKPAIKPARKQRARREGDMLSVPSHIRVQNKANRKCEWPGCNARFQRQEHLKRHEKTHTKAEVHRCQFCNWEFGRSDNLKSHTRLHTDPNKKNPRTAYHPEALEVYEEMSRKSRKTGNSKSRDSRPQLDTPTAKASLRSRGSDY